MNTERYNPNLDTVTRGNRPPPLNFEGKEDYRSSCTIRDGYRPNIPAPQYGTRNGRTLFAELNDRSKKI